MKTASLFNRITRTLATASQLILAAPVRLPAKVVAIAKYVSLGATLLEALNREDEPAETANHSPEHPWDEGKEGGTRDGH